MLAELFEKAERLKPYLESRLDLRDGAHLLLKQHEERERPLSDYAPRLEQIVAGRILLISDTWCSDGAINMGLFLWLSQQNYDLDIRVIGSAGLDQMIMKLLEAEKVKTPLAIVLSEDLSQVKGIFVERPKDIRALENSEDQLKRIKLMRAYRDGLFLWQTLEELLSYLES